MHSGSWPVGALFIIYLPRFKCGLPLRPGKYCLWLESRIALPVLGHAFRRSSASGLFQTSRRYLRCRVVNELPSAPHFPPTIDRPTVCKKRAIHHIVLFNALLRQLKWPISTRLLLSRSSGCSPLHSFALLCSSMFAYWLPLSSDHEFGPST